VLVLCCCAVRRRRLSTFRHARAPPPPRAAAAYVRYNTQPIRRSLSFSCSEMALSRSQPVRLGRVPGAQLRLCSASAAAPPLKRTPPSAAVPRLHSVTGAPATSLRAGAARLCGATHSAARHSVRLNARRGGDDSPDATERVVAAVPYLLPLLDGIRYRRGRVIPPLAHRPDFRWRAAAASSS